MKELEYERNNKVMINESYVWKKELKKEMRVFKRFLIKLSDLEGKTDDEYLMLKMEKFFFVSSFIVRKLLEAGKLSDDLKSVNISIIEYKRVNKEKMIWKMNNHKIDYFYDLNSEKKSSMNIQRLCNVFIHSFIFMPCYSYIEETEEVKPPLNGVLVTSENTKDNALFYIDVNDFFKVLEEVIKDNILYEEYNYATGTQKSFRTEPSRPLTPMEILEEDFIREQRKQLKHLKREK